MESKTAEDFLIGALIGGAIGAAAALILTPFSGDKLRRKIKNRFSQLENSYESMRSSDRPRSSGHLHKRSGSTSSSKGGHSKSHAKAAHAKPAYAKSSHAKKPKPKDE